MSVVAPPEFVYVCARSLDEALAAMSSEPETLALAGGTDLVAMRASGQLSPRMLVDVKHVDELTGVSDDDGRLRIASATRLAELVGEPAIRGTALADGAAVVGAVQTRERATLGGNVCRSSPAGDTLPGLLVLKASAEIRSSEGTRAVALERFFLGPGHNDLSSDELLHSLSLSVDRGASAYRRLTYRAWMDLAVIGVAVWLDLDGEACVDARVALGGLGPTPILSQEAGAALVGTGLDLAAIGQACDAAEAVASPISDVRGTSDYRVAGLRALLPRVVETARSRAGKAA